MQGEIRAMGVGEARRRLPEILRAANREGAVPIVTKRGQPYAAVVPVAQAPSAGPSLSDLRGSAEGCFGDAGQFVRRLRGEWE